jgi:hypothetical protein
MLTPIDLTNEQVTFFMCENKNEDDIKDLLCYITKYFASYIYLFLINFETLNPLSSKTVNWRYQGGVKHQEAFSGAHVISFDYTGFLMVFKHLGNTIQTLLCCSYP